ncbi:MAG TPA: hypothetical protein DCS28_02705 [Candidatus Moranbacteria bacterium]|nr:hypothetical protein [Candidatus Moranbacteria bacterium]HAT74926.1 hypothetical protein [Candidatus Moranbacteria bacterium]
MLQKINKFILDALFPIACFFCGKRDTWLCDECLRKLPLLAFQLCPYCEKEIVSNGHFCEKCKKTALEKNIPPPLDALICAIKYSGISKFVHLFKYNFVSDLGAPLGKIIVKNFLKSNLPLPDFIIPVPIHKRKLKWRGFNQAEILAQTVSQNLTPGILLPVHSDILVRRSNTRAQMKIKNYQKRLANIRGAFAVSPEKEDLIRDKKILLIDDIATTGATLFECAKILKSAGAKKVCGAVIARQEFK